MSRSEQFISGLNSAMTALTTATSHTRFQFATQEEVFLAFQHMVALTVRLNTASSRIVDALVRTSCEIEDHGGSVDQSLQDAVEAMQSVQRATDYSARRAASAAQVAISMHYPKPTKSR